MTTEWILAIAFSFTAFSMGTGGEAVQVSSHFTYQHRFESKEACERYFLRAGKEVVGIFYPGLRYRDLSFNPSCHEAQGEAQ